MARLDTKVLDWLMVGDPAIRWQVRRDLLDEGFRPDHGIDFPGNEVWRRRREQASRAPSRGRGETCVTGM
jgi:hypothetical protein